MGWGLSLVSVSELLSKILCTFLSDREEFDEEKEPDGMLLSGWTQASSVEKDDNKSNGNGGSTSNASQVVPVDAEDNVEMDVPSGKKRRLSEISDQGLPSFTDETKNHGKLEVVDDDDDLVMLDGDPGLNKRKRMQ